MRDEHHVWCENWRQVVNTDSCEDLPLGFVVTSRDEDCRFWGHLAREMAPESETPALEISCKSDVVDVPVCVCAEDNAMVSCAAGQTF